MAQEPMTYTKNQPTDNVDAWRLGEACRAAAADPKCGDPIDRGLILLRELEAKGYGVVKLVHNVEFSGVPAGHSINHPAGGTSAGTQG